MPVSAFGHSKNFAKLNMWAALTSYSGVAGKALSPPSKIRASNAAAGKHPRTPLIRRGDPGTIVSAGRLSLVRPSGSDIWIANQVNFVLMFRHQFGRLHAP